MPDFQLFVDTLVTLRRRRIREVLRSQEGKEGREERKKEREGNEGKGKTDCLRGKAFETVDVIRPETKQEKISKRVKIKKHIDK